jgi:hypothetical protein
VATTVALVLCAAPSHAAVVGRITEVLTHTVTTAPASPLGSATVSPYIELTFASIDQPIDLVIAQGRGSNQFRIRSVVRITPQSSVSRYILHEGVWSHHRYADVSYIPVTSLALSTTLATTRSLLLFDRSTTLTTRSPDSAAIAQPGLIDAITYTLGSATAHPYPSAATFALPLTGGGIYRRLVTGSSDLLVAGTLDASLKLPTGDQLNPGLANVALPPVSPPPPPPAPPEPPGNPLQSSENSSPDSPPAIPEPASALLLLLCVSMGTLDHRRRRVR